MRTLHRVRRGYRQNLRSGEHLSQRERPGIGRGSVNDSEAAARLLVSSAASETIALK